MQTVVDVRISAKVGFGVDVMITIPGVKVRADRTLRYPAALYEQYLDATDWLGTSPLDSPEEVLHKVNHALKEADENTQSPKRPRGDTARP